MQSVTYMNNATLELKRVVREFVIERIPFGLFVYLIVGGIPWGITLLIPLPEHVGSSLGLFEVSWFGLVNWILMFSTFFWAVVFVGGNISDLRPNPGGKEDFLDRIIYFVGVLSGAFLCWLLSWHVIHRPDFAGTAFKGNMAAYHELCSKFPVGSTFVVNGIGEYPDSRSSFTTCYSLSGTGKWQGKIVLVPTNNYPTPVQSGTKVSLWVDPPTMEKPLWYTPTPTFVPQSE